VSADLDFALSLADDADTLSLPRFRAVDLHVETKPDLTPVTDADKAVERALRERIARERPTEGVLGEEEGDEGRPAAEGGVLRPGGDGIAGAASRPVRWILDPIDGTKNFSRGIPVWATLIALERDGEIVCGVASAPALGHRWWAARGKGAYRDGEPLHVSEVARLEESTVSCVFARDLARFEDVVRHARGYGDFWQHMLVAEGAVDVAVDAVLARWDVAALEPIVTGAGGRLDALPNGQSVSTNGRLHDAAFSRLAGAG
jgi:histidinol-phosphatase